MAANASFVLPGGSKGVRNQIRGPEDIVTLRRAS